MNQVHAIVKFDIAKYEFADKTPRNYLKINVSQTLLDKENYRCIVFVITR